MGGEGRGGEGRGVGAMCVHLHTADGRLLHGSLGRGASIHLTHPSSSSTFKEYFAPSGGRCQQLLRRCRRCRL